MAVNLTRATWLSLICGCGFFICGSFAAAEVPAPPGQVGIPYQIEATKSCGNGGSGCSVEFPFTPAKRRVDLERVNCGVQGAVSIVSIALFLEPNSLISQELIEDQAIAMGGGQTRHLFDQPTGMSIAAGRQATVNVLTSIGSVGMRCTLFGTLVFLP